MPPLKMAIKCFHVFLHLRFCSVNKGGGLKWLFTAECFKFDPFKVNYGSK